MDSWKLREALFLSLSQWYQVLAFILIGAMIGFGFASLTPAPYQATRDLYLGIDISRVNEMAYLIPLAEHEPLNIDDYKNWQLKQSADLLRSDQVLKNALDALKESDPIWEEYSVADLRKTIDIYWFEAGTWRLEVVMSEKDLALAAVDAWLTKGSEYISDLLRISQAGYDLDQEIWTINLALGDAKYERAKLERFLTTSEEWTAHLADLGGEDPIAGEDYQAISNWVLAYSEVSPFWSKFLEDFPSLDQSNEKFKDWLVDKLAGARIAQAEVSAQIDILQADKDLILPDYHQYLEDSQGLSSNLVLNPDISEVQVKQIYSWDTTTLGGGILGLLAWVLVVLYKIRSLKVADEE